MPENARFANFGALSPNTNYRIKVIDYINKYVELNKFYDPQLKIL